MAVRCFTFLYLFASSERDRKRDREKEREGEPGSFLTERPRQMLLHIGNRKGTKDGRGYPALSTRDSVVNNASPWRQTRRSESWQSVRSGWPLAISLLLSSSLSVSPFSSPTPPPPLSLFLILPLSLFFSIFSPCSPGVCIPSRAFLFPSRSPPPALSLYPYLSPPEPVAHKLIRSRCLLARDSHWPPRSRRSFCSPCCSLLPPPPRSPPPVPPLVVARTSRGIETTLFLRGCPNTGETNAKRRALPSSARTFLEKIVKGARSGEVPRDLTDRLRDPPGFTSEIARDLSRGPRTIDRGARGGDSRRSEPDVARERILADQ